MLEKKNGMHVIKKWYIDYEKKPANTRAFNAQQ